MRMRAAFLRTLPQRLVVGCGEIAEVALELELLEALVGGVSLAEQVLKDGVAAEVVVEGWSCGLSSG